MDAKRYQGFLDQIKGGKVVALHGYSANSKAELDTLLTYPAFIDAEALVPIEAEPEVATVPKGDDNDPPKDKELDDMTHQELKVLAMSKGLDFSGNIKKVDLVALIKGAE